MHSDTVEKLATLVRDIARRELLPRFACKSGTRKADGSLVTEADLVTHEALKKALEEQWPAYTALSEEMDETDQQQALDNCEQGVWCIDPLDGTSNFAVGVPYYAVSVALLIGCRVELGVVYDPSRDECFTAVRGQGARLNGQRLRQTDPQTTLSDSVALIDLKRLGRELASRLAAEPPYKSQRSFGAVALDWCWLAAGRGDIYLHGRQKLWDYAAGSLVLLEAGGQGVNLRGDPLFSPTLEERSAVAALDPVLFAQWKKWLGIHKR